MLKSLALLPFLAPLSLWAQVNSDTVPTSLLEANFSIMADSSSNTVTALVDLEEAGAVNGIEQDTPVAIAADETISFIGGGSEMNYTANGADTLPFDAGGTYLVGYARYNGESYSASVTIPSGVQFTAPAPNSTANVTDPVDVIWGNSQEDMQVVVVSSTCEDLVDASTFDDSGLGITFPAGSAATCTGTPQAEVDVLNVNGGSGFGSYGGQMTSSFTVNYNGPAPSTLPKLSRKDLAKYVRRAIKSGERLIRVHR